MHPFATVLKLLQNKKDQKKFPGAQFLVSFSKLPAVKKTSKTVHLEKFLALHILWRLYHFIYLQCGQKSMKMQQCAVVSHAARRAVCEMEKNALGMKNWCATTSMPSTMVCNLSEGAHLFPALRAFWFLKKPRSAKIVLEGLILKIGRFQFNIITVLNFGIGLNWDI